MMALLFAKLLVFFLYKVLEEVQLLIRDLIFLFDIFLKLIDPLLTLKVFSDESLPLHLQLRQLSLLARLNHAKWLWLLSWRLFL